MKKGISVWLFSKVVMLVFLMTVFAIVLSFLRLITEKVGADAAESLAMQVKNSIKIVLDDALISASRVVPLPQTLPEKGDVAQIPETRLKPYSITIKPSGNLAIVAVSWDIISKTKPEISSYVAASSFLTTADVPEITVNSIDHHFLAISRDSANQLQFCGCQKADCSPSGSSPTKDICCTFETFETVCQQPS